MASASGYKGVVTIPIVAADDISAGLEEWTLTHNIDEFEAVAKKQAFVETFFTAKEWEATVRVLVPAGMTNVAGWQMLSHDGADLDCVFIWEEGTTDWKATGKAQIDDHELSDPRDGPVEVTLHLIGTNSDGLGLVFATGS